MAVRIRKLARELNRTPRELIGVLHALGFNRYRSPEDMLNGRAEAKLRRGLAKGVAPVDVDVAPGKKRTTSLEQLAQQDDLMAKLVPGVVPTDGPSPAPPTTRPSPRPTPAPPTQASSLSARPAVPVARPTPPPARSRARDVEREALESLQRSVASQRAVLETSRAELEAEREQLARRERALEAEAASLATLRDALERERSLLEAERSTLSDLQARRSASSGQVLQDLLEERGLRGADEFERALIALADARLLRDVLWTVRLDPPDAMRRVLSERLVLIAGDPHPVLSRGAATVRVAPERAEAPGAADIERALTRLGERLMLAGVRRLRLVGGAPRWQRLLHEGIDPRVEIQVMPPARRTVEAARADVVEADLVVLWGVEVDPEALDLYEAARPELVRVEAGGLQALLAAVHARLEA